MKCFNHHGADAVGVCKNCGKGICPDCLTDTGYGVACTDTCAGKMKSNRKTGLFVGIFVGIVLILMGAEFGYRAYAKQSMTMYLFSGFMIVMGIFSMTKRATTRNGNN